MKVPQRGRGNLTDKRRASELPLLPTSDSAPSWSLRPRFAAAWDNGWLGVPSRTLAAEVAPKRGVYRSGFRGRGAGELSLPLSKVLLSGHTAEDLKFTDGGRFSAGTPVNVTRRKRPFLAAATVRAIRFVPVYSDWSEINFQLLLPDLLIFQCDTASCPRMGK